jgi:hypothetical protein
MRSGLFVVRTIDSECHRHPIESDRRGIYPESFRARVQGFQVKNEGDAGKETSHGKVPNEGSKSGETTAPGPRKNRSNCFRWQEVCAEYDPPRPITCKRSTNDRLRE